MNNQEKNNYVRSQILNTLLDMLKTYDIASISISKLTSKAMIGRASFYRNYDSKEDVLCQEAKRLNKELDLICKDDNPNDIQLRIIRIMDFYKLHSDFYLTLYKSNQKHLIQEFIVKDQDISQDMSTIMAYTLSAFSYLIYGWIIEWIKRGMTESSKEIIDMFGNTSTTKIS